MHVLTQIYSTVNDVMAFGDTDHDSLREVIMPVTFGAFDYRILEEQGNNTYAEVFIGPYINPYAAGDFDRDGNAEIVAQTNNTLSVYESPSPSTHPSVLSWQSPPLTNIIGYATAADTDGDGQMEIIHSINTFGTARLVIYENTGDNSFTQVFFEVTSPQDDGPKLIADLDGDGRTEIAFCGTYGYLRVYESTANDTWQLTFLDSTGLSNAYAVTGGTDTDGNGKPEIFMTGDFEQAPGTRHTYVYEAAGDDSFAVVTILPYFDDHLAGLRSCVANLDAVGREEFILHVDPGLLIYRGVSPGQWAIALTVPDPDPDGTHVLVLPYDANRNGRPELFWVETGHAAFGYTLVLEHPEVTPSDARSLDAGAEQLVILPNPCRSEATVRLAGPLKMATWMTTFDAAGRRVSRVPIAESGGGVPWPPLQLARGIYFVRLDNGHGDPLGVGRVTIVR
jgi:hypothetical protein